VLRHLLLGLTLVACVLLAIAEFSHLNHIQILTVRRHGLRVGPHHGYALLIIALAAAVMAAGARRGSRPAAIALGVLGVAALLIVLLVDLPDVDATGLYGRNYERARAVADSGYRFELVGSVLLLFAGVLTAVSPARSPAVRRPQPVGTEEGESAGGGESVSA
jgi:hypothetical protein